MRARSSHAYKAVKVRVHQHFIGFRNKMGPYSEAMAVLLIGAIYLLVLMRYGLASASDWISVIVVFVATAISVFILAKLTASHSILIEVTMSYIIKGGRVLLDELLGKLIGRRWQREHLKPGEALFDVLEDASTSGNYESRRRIAEALPALGEIDARRTSKLLKILRCDWDDEKYRTDIRRRSIEALVIPAVSGHLPLMHRIALKDLQPILGLHEKDEIYTAFAVAEAINELLAGGKKTSQLAANLKVELLRFANREYSAEEYEGLSALLELLKFSRSADVFEVADRLKAMSTSPNRFVQIAAARNILLIRNLEEKTLDLMDHFTNPDQHRNVRRPISNERNLMFLMEQMKSKGLKARAESLLNKLLHDPDQIIRITAFDLAESLKEQNREFLKNLCDEIEKHEPFEEKASQDLISRASRIRAGLT